MRTMNNEEKHINKTFETGEKKLKSSFYKE